MTVTDHQRILDAIAAGDPERARSAMAAHLERVYGHWERLHSKNQGG
jgi:DNA-binding FadR family transcriptional regulator